MKAKGANPNQKIKVANASSKDQSTEEIRANQETPQQMEITTPLAM